MPRPRKSVPLGWCPGWQARASGSHRRRHSLRRRASARRHGGNHPGRGPPVLRRGDRWSPEQFCQRSKHLRPSRQVLPRQEGGAETMSPAALSAAAPRSIRAGRVTPRVPPCSARAAGVPVDLLSSAPSRAGRTRPRPRRPSRSGRAPPAAGRGSGDQPPARCEHFMEALGHVSDRLQVEVNEHVSTEDEVHPPGARPEGRVDVQSHGSGTRT